MESLKFLSSAEVRELRERFGTPLYVYDESTLRKQAEIARAFPAPFGLTVRYAMKASPSGAILQLFDQCGLHFDASSGFEVERLFAAGIAPEKISLSSQELPTNFADLIRAGISLNACSLDQLERFGKAFPGTAIGIRFNPGLGSGHSNRTNVGGPGSSFGIWHEKADQVRAIAAKHRLEIVRIHTHIGSGTDPAVWAHVAELNLTVLRQFPTVSVLNMGGGFRVGRMSGETSTDLLPIGKKLAEGLEKLAAETGREIKVEIEPGTLLVANAGAIVSSIQDIVDTGGNGYTFLKLDTGMTEILRPSLYGAQHPLVVVPANDSTAPESAEYLVVGHCCESGDILTPAPDAPEILQPRKLQKAAIGDLLVIEGAGAYCSAMPAKNYNSFPEAPEILRRCDGSFDLIRKRQTVAQMIANELPLS